MEVFPLLYEGVYLCGAERICGNGAHRGVVVISHGATVVNLFESRDSPVPCHFVEGELSVLLYGLCFGL